MSLSSCPEHIACLLNSRYLLLTDVVCCARQKANMAAAPTLITDARRQVVDFTIPFMTTQATLLLRRPPPGTELRVKDLADLVAQSEIKYGTLRKGFIPRNFRSTNDTLLTIVWRNMRRLVTAAVPQGSHVQVLNVPENPEFFILF